MTRLTVSNMTTPQLISFLAPTSFKYIEQPNPLTKRRQRYCPQSRISNALPAYRQALLRTASALSSSPVTNTINGATPTNTVHAAPKNGASTTPLQPVVPQWPDTRPKDTNDKVPSGKSKFTVRVARQHELYTAADIRCEAFYCSSQTAAYRPVRRREIYMAMQSRVASGTCCIVIIDNHPPQPWQTFANYDGLVVGTLDITLHCSQSGNRKMFNHGSLHKANPAVYAYISSMAVRQEWQRRGLAQLLMAHANQMIPRIGVTGTYLHVDPDNDTAAHVYKKAGFRTIVDSSVVPSWIFGLAKPECTLMYKQSLETTSFYHP